MKPIHPQQGLSTLMLHVEEQNNPLGSHVTPIYQTSTFNFPDVETGAAIFSKTTPGYVYTRLANPNLDQLGLKIAVMEGLDLLRSRPDREPREVVGGLVFSSGMAAISAALMARVKPGQTILAQSSLYSATFSILNELAQRMNCEVVFLSDTSTRGWEKAFRAHPKTVLSYVETPSNPLLNLVDLEDVAEISHRSGAWMFADNTFATPFCQRPLTLGADLVIHSTTKYLAGHGVVTGGAVVSPHLDFLYGDLAHMASMLGGTVSPFDAWLTNNGLKTFELRMERHCENALAVARYLDAHPKIARVYYPGLESHADAGLAKRQMKHFGGMVSFELSGGYRAGEILMNRVRVSTLAVSLGNVDSLICHPASMTHSSITAEERRKMGVAEGLVRFSVGIENVKDLLEDLEQALEGCPA